MSPDLRKMMYQWVSELVEDDAEELQAARSDRSGYTTDEAIAYLQAYEATLKSGS